MRNNCTTSITNHTTKAAANNTSSGAVALPAVSVFESKQEALHPINGRAERTPIQGKFVWKDVPDEEVDDNDVKNADKKKVFTRSNTIASTFLSYAQNKLADNGENINTNEIKKMITEGYKSPKSIDIGNKRPLSDALIDWLQQKAASEKGYATARGKRKAAPICGSNKRKVYNPSAVVGDSTGVPGRVSKTLLERQYSMADAMSHEPVFGFSGENVSKLTQVNHNATYSIGAYAVDGMPAHFIGGSKSGETFSKSTEKKEMHAEEQQIAGFKDQVAQNSHGLNDAFTNGTTVVLHLHISKSPCSDQCQKMFDLLLSDPAYSTLEVQLYLEIPYMANEPDEMKREAAALKKLMDKYPGRLAYQVVSTEVAKKMQDTIDDPIKRLKGLEKLMYMIIVKEGDRDPNLAAGREQKFKDLVGANLLPAPGYVSSLC